MRSSDSFTAVRTTFALSSQFDQGPSIRLPPAVVLRNNLQHASHCDSFHTFFVQPSLIRNPARVMYSLINLSWHVSGADPCPILGNKPRLRPSFFRLQSKMASMFSPSNSHSMSHTSSFATSRARSVQIVPNTMIVTSSKCFNESRGS
eukprot:2810866-Rhodomonas_salina.1